MTESDSSGGDIAGTLRALADELERLANELREGRIDPERADLPAHLDPGPFEAQIPTDPAAPRTHGAWAAAVEWRTRRQTLADPDVAEPQLASFIGLAQHLAIRAEGFGVDVPEVRRARAALLVAARNIQAKDIAAARLAADDIEKAAAEIRVAFLDRIQPPGDLIKRLEAAKLAQVSENTIDRRAADGTLTAWGKPRRFSEAQVQRVIDSDRMVERHHAKPADKK